MADPTVTAPPTAAPEIAPSAGVVLGPPSIRQLYVPGPATVASQVQSTAVPVPVPVAT